MGDTQSKIEYLKRLAPAERKIKQRNFEARMGLEPGALSEAFLTVPKKDRVVKFEPEQAAKPKPITKAKAKAKPKKKKAPKKKA